MVIYRSISVCWGSFMVVGILSLLLFQLLGHVLVGAFNLPIPPPVLGLVLLFCYLLVRGQADESLVKTTSILLPLLPLFLIPAGAGIVQHHSLLANEWIPIAVALSVSLVASLVIVPFVFLFFIRLFRKQ